MNSNLLKHTKIIGQISECAFLFECAKFGLSIYKPVNEISKTDYIIELEDGRLIKVQCKTLAKIKTSQNSFSAKLTATKQNYTTHTYENIRYTLKEVDIFSLYCTELNEVFLIPAKELCDENGIIQISITLNNSNEEDSRQLAKVRFCSDYKFEKIIQNILNNQEISKKPILKKSKPKSDPLNRIGESGYKGVKRASTGNKKWESYIRINNKNIYIGRSDDPKELALKYDEKAIELLGEKAVTNKSLGLL